MKLITFAIWMLAFASLLANFCNATNSPPSPLALTPAPDLLNNFAQNGGSMSSVEDIEPIVEWEKKQNADQRLEVFGDDFLGDAIDPHTGSLVFSHTDIDIPGNSKLRVALSRQRTAGLAYKDGVDAEFGDWTLSVPRITVTSLDARPWTGSRCSKKSTEILTGYSNRSSFMSARDYSNGITLEIPGQSSQQLLDDNNNPIFPSTATKVTKHNWYFTCTSASDGGQGFIGHAPNGDKYYFNRAYVLDAPKMGYIGADPLERNVYIIAATKVTDVHGNYVNYNYDASNRLSSIIAKDGRRIHLYYSEKLITRAVSGGKAWHYSYRTNTYRRAEWMPYYPQSLRGKVLANVTQPDGLRWTMNLDKMTATPAPSGRDYCQKWDHTISITHPYGAIGTFKLKDTEHRHLYASQVRRYENCMSAEPTPGGGGTFFSTPSPLATKPTSPDNLAPPFRVSLLNNTYMPLDDDVTTSTMSVTEKTVSGPSMTPATWHYTYENNQGPSSSSSSDRTNWTKVDAPDGHHTYYHAWVSEPLAGKLIKKETRASSSGAVLRTETYSYYQENSVGSSYVLTYPGPGDLETPVHTTRVVVAQSGDTYTTDYGFNTNHNSAAYSYSTPVSKSVKSNVSTTARVTTTQFGHNKTKWILNLPVKQTVNGRTTVGNEYDGKERTTVENVFDGNGRKILEKRYEAPFATYGYHTNGTFAWAKDANNRIVRADLYKRGTPQKVTRADGKFVYQYVDDFGRITSMTDALGNTTSYSRDSMGRLLVANPPDSWENTYHSYNFSGNPTHTITLGDARTTISYDEMFRPVLVETRDLLTNKSTFVNYDYDEAGREIFSSFPSASNVESAGTETEYDGLGRVTKKRETVSPFATTTLSYHSSHKRIEKDPEDNETHYFSYGYDGPDGNDIRAIRSPLGKNTDINKNVWGETVYIRQWGSQNGYNVNEYRYYYYDDRRRLCRVSEKDVGDTLYDYDDSNWLVAYQKGLSKGTACPPPSGTAKVSLTRDEVGRITKRDFAHSGTPDIIKTYDANGNVLSANRGGIDWTYEYNTINLPTLERLNVDGRAYQLVHSYNLSGHKTQTMMPTGRTVSFNVDGLGRPRRANSGSTYYANNVTYHPSGQVEKFNFGNGHYFTQTLNSRMLPSRLHTYKDSTKAIDVAYGYDKRGLVTSITDYAQSNNNRTMTYDALEQVITASGPWGAGYFEYDSLGNIRKKDLGSRKVTVNYSNNRVSSSIDTGGLGGNTGTRTFTHDSRGNVTKAGNINFVYDYADQPTSISGSESGQYHYDANLKRVKSTVGGKTIYNVFDSAGKLVHIDNVTTNKKTDYISIGQMTVARVENNVPTYLHNDSLGSPVSGTDASGAVKWTERYTPYGITLDNAAANDDQAGYTGHIKDSDTGLVYMQARYYDPVIGRFYSNDPVDVMGHMATGDYIHGFNRYRYGKNNPYKYTDPSGKIDIPVNFVSFFGNNEGANIVAKKQQIISKALVSPKASPETLKVVSDTATAVAILSPVGRGVAGAVALGADVADIAVNSNDLATDVTAKAMGEIAASSVSKKLGPLIDALPTKGIKENVSGYLKESSKELIKDQVSSGTEDIVKERSQ